MSTLDTAPSPTVRRRGLAEVVTLPAPGPGFIGEGHTAIHVIDPARFAHNDPFIMLADDRVDLPPGAACRWSASACRFRNPDVRGRGRGARPRRGAAASRRRSLDDRRQRRRPQRGPGAAGQGAHSAVVGDVAERVALGRAHGSSTSRARTRRSGRSPGSRHASTVERRERSPRPSHTYLPMTVVDIRLAPNAVFEQEVPSSYNGFLYPLEGELLVDGRPPQRLSVGQIGWLEFGSPSTTVRLTAGQDGARVIVYAGERQDVPIVTHGPFVGETRSDLVRVSTAYAQGRMPRISELGR